LLIKVDSFCQAQLYSKSIAYSETILSKVKLLFKMKKVKAPRGVSSLENVW